VRPGERIFSPGPHHGHYSYTVESDPSDEPIINAPIHLPA
jgi:hypothetical protein